MTGITENIKFGERAQYLNDQNFSNNYPTTTLYPLSLDR